MFRNLFLPVLILLGCLTSFAADGPFLPSVTWTQVSPAASPSARMVGAMAYDLSSGLVVLFGGYDGRAYLNDTWTFDGVNWTKQSPASAPPVRTAAGMAYDRRSKQLVLFGGYDGHNYLGDTWMWSSSTHSWTQGNPTHQPKPVTGPQVFTDPVSGRVVMFGGFDGNLYQLITWGWTGSEWSQQHVSNIPSARSAAIVATNTVDKSTVMFDGLGDVNPYNTWTWNGSDWTLQAPPVQPQSLYDAGSSFDPNVGAIVLFGGAHAGLDQNQTWAWTGSNWLQLVPAQSPPARESFGMAYDNSYGHTVIFGGFTGSGYLGDTWILTRQ